MFIGQTHTLTDRQHLTSLFDSSAGRAKKVQCTVFVLLLCILWGWWEDGNDWCGDGVGMGTNVLGTGRRFWVRGEGGDEWLSACHSLSPGTLHAEALL